MTEVAHRGPRVRTIISTESRPALPAHIKMRHDPGRGRWHLLAPERVFEPDEPAVEVLKLCDGVRTVKDIAAMLSKQYDAPVDDISADVVTMLQELADKGVVKAEKGGGPDE